MLALSSRDPRVLQLSSEMNLTLQGARIHSRQQVMPHIFERGAASKGATQGYGVPT